MRHPDSPSPLLLHSSAKADTISATIWEFWCGRDDLDAGYSYHQQGEAQEEEKRSTP
jgi:hypothetical protein